jgi:hypothetical protein
MDNGPTAPKWVSVSTSGPMAIFIRASIFQISERERASTCGRMARYWRDGGRRIVSMVRPSSRKSIKKKVSSSSSMGNSMPIDSHDIQFFSKSKKNLSSLVK